MHICMHVTASDTVWKHILQLRSYVYTVISGMHAHTAAGEI